MAAINLSAPARLPLTGTVTLGLAGVAQEITLAGTRPDMVLTLYLVTNAGKYTTDPAVVDGASIGANYGPPIAPGAPAEIFLPGGTRDALTKLCVSGDVDATVLRYEYNRVTRAGR